MTYFLDTSVAIHLRDGDPEVTERVATLGSLIMLSITSRVELEGGVLREPVEASAHRARLDVMMEALPVLDFARDSADAYRLIVEAAGYSRRKIRDRMIAARALAHRATLVTFNADDFRDIPGLSLLAW